jgi:tetratricopeptide (TPR) repeat protein
MRRPRFIALLLALTTLVAYLPVAHNSFLNYDDNDYVTENRVVENGLTWAGTQWAFTTWHASNWHPLTWLSHMLDYELFGLNAGAQHYVSVLFHTANAVLLLLLLFRLTGALWPSAFVAALFAWHPLHVESVAWISERKDVLSTFFEMLALLAYARFVAESKVQSPKSKVFYVLALLMFALGLMAKPMLVTLPFLLLLLDYWPLQRFPNFKLEVKTVFRLALEKWPFFLLTVASCIVTFLAQRAEAVVSIERYPLNLRLGNALLSYVLYLGKAIWPTKLAIVYPLQNQLPWAAVLAAVVFLAFITWLAWRMRRRHSYLPVGWFWFLGMLVPVIGLIQVGAQSMADRYTYVPLIGIFIAVAFGSKDLIARFQIGVVTVAAAAGLVLGSCLVGTRHQLSYWKDGETLFTRARAVTKNNGTAHYNLGFELEKRGYQIGAITNYQEALRVDPGNIRAHNNLGNIFSKTGKTNEALVQYQEAMKLNPKEPLVYVNLGTLLVRMGRLEEGISQYNQAIQLDPDDSRPHYSMGIVLLHQGRDADAVDHFRKAMQLNPNDFLTLAFLARVLASDENPQNRNGAEAVALAESANDLTDGEYPFALDTLAMSYAEVGRLQDAQQIEQRAIRLAQAAGLEETNAMAKRLELYKSGRTYRETFTNSSLQNLPKN